MREARGLFDICDSVHRFVAHREAVVAQEHGVGAYGKARADVYVERARMMIARGGGLKCVVLLRGVFRVGRSRLGRKKEHDPSQ